MPKERKAGSTKPSSGLDSINPPPLYPAESSMTLPPPYFPFFLSISQSPPTDLSSAKNLPLPLTMFTLPKVTCGCSPSCHFFTGKTSIFRPFHFQKPYQNNSFCRGIPSTIQKLHNAPRGSSPLQKRLVGCSSRNVTRMFFFHQRLPISTR